MFVAVGHDPRSELFSGQLATDADGYLLVDQPSTRTAIDGVFAAGDDAGGDAGGYAGGNCGSKSSSYNSSCAASLSCARSILGSAWAMRWRRRSIIPKRM